MDNKSAICRICLISKNELLLPMSEEFQGVFCRILYYECTGEFLREYPNYPSNICRVCRTEMISAYRFKKKCLETDKKLSAKMKQEVQQEEQQEAQQEEQQEVEPIVLKFAETEEQESSSEEDQINEAPLIEEIFLPETTKQEYEDSESVHDHEIMKKPNLTRAEHQECVVCHNLFKNMKELNDHRASVHNLSPVISPCFSCGKTFPTYQTKINHNCQRKCDHCGEIVKGNLFFNHYRAHKIPPEPYIQCEFCPRKFQYRCRYNNHKKIHTSRTINCPVCEKPVKECYIKYHLETHEEPAQELLIYTCAKCGKQFKGKCWKRSLKKHMDVVHLNIRKGFQCRYCDIVFKNDSARLAHEQRDHLKKPLKVCEFCGKKFYILMSYLNHLTLAHKTSTPFSCSICGKSYKTKFTLVTHEKSHSKNFKCSHCPKIFKCSTTLGNHLREVRGENIYLCPYCPNTFSWNFQVRKHLQNDHADKEMPPPRTVFLKSRVEKLINEWKLVKKTMQKFEKTPVNPQELNEKRWWKYFKD